MCEHYAGIVHLYSILQGGITNAEQYPYLSWQQVHDLCFRCGAIKGLSAATKKASNAARYASSEESDAEVEPVAVP